MKQLLLLSVLSFAGCVSGDGTEDPGTDPVDLFDPTGRWAMVGLYGAGSCNASGSFTQPITVVKSGSQFLASTGIAGDVTTGLVSRDGDSASLNLTIANQDVLNNGGGVRGTTTIVASTDGSTVISGSGNVVLSGGIVCAHQFTLSGTLEQ